MTLSLFDETTLIWLSHGQEKNLKLSSISRIVPGQRTAVFRRFLRPEKEYLSFSLLYNKGGDRSLDLICKDKAEVEVWLSGLKALIGQNRKRRTKSDLSDLQEGYLLQNGRPFGALEFSNSISSSVASFDIGSSDAGSERANMQMRPSNADGFRISVSSTPSCSSGGSGGPDDIESLGDVYMWGEVWPDGSDGPVSSVSPKIDVLTPRPLESNVVLDVHQIACGVRHIALVTKQGEVFTWGEESGGRLGHGTEKDFNHPRLVEFLAVTNVEFVASGEYHTCVVSSAGDLFTWGDGVHNAGLLGHGTDVSHWIPKRVSGALEGHQVLSISCGTWHSALATSNGKLFTFGDGRFGVLGHGDRENSAYPKEVQMLNGLKTVKVACGVWHTAAIVEVSGQSGANISSRKLFTWGDGDKHRLGHGSKESYLLPFCVSSLIDYNFHQIACGHTITVALTTSGHVFTMGSTAYGQLGNPSSDGKLPCLVQDNLVGEFVEEIAVGHIMLLSKKALKAALAPTPGKPHRVCDGCYTKLKSAEAGNTSLLNRKFAGPRSSIDGKERSVDSHRGELRSSRLLLSRNTELIKYLEIMSGKPGSRVDASQMRASQFPSPIQLREAPTPSPLVPFQTAFRPATSPATPPHSPMNSRSSSPYSRRPSPPRCTNTFSKNVIESLRRQPAIKTNPFFSTFERLQVKSLKQKCDTQNVEIQKLRKKAQESALNAVRESSKFKEAKEVVKSITDELKELFEKLPSEVSESETFKAMNTQAEAFLSTYGKPDASLPATLENQTVESTTAIVPSNDSGSSRDAAAQPSSAELTEQFEPGVYITYVNHPNGGRSSNEFDSANESSPSKRLKNGGAIIKPLEVHLASPYMGHQQVRLGLKINLSKSMLFDINVNDEVIFEWAAAIGCTESGHGSLPTIKTPGVVKNCCSTDEFGECLRSNFRLKPGNGESIRFWHDAWLDGVPLRELMQWNELMALLYNLNPSSSMDNSLLWEGEGDGRFSVKFCLEIFLGTSFDSFPWKRTVWAGVAPPRVKYFIWQVVHKKVVVKCLGGYGLASCAGERFHLQFQSAGESLVRDLLLADHVMFDEKISQKVVSWSPPPTGFVKLNVDGAMERWWSKGGIGGLIRDEKGVILGSFLEQVGSSPPIMA
ncbi:hypothetical protein F3Y22_tig00110403pilonHSYRG00168 [Hibiscus syriacus]|uniref:Regulator of chromosome condensation (RCC1) family with FYVE zinc finger domain n=1 Tax=Hibiscus syriacus TaxID=106335 RepID=A0A6A3ANJ8_HIBSY|nr:hypothetical protein F3Y22_tig00110403pilonHSYRG00168 [Hibiscus syriacus]